MKLPKQYLALVIIVTLLIIAGIIYLNRSPKDLSQNSDAYSAGSQPVTNQPTDSNNSNFDKKQHSLDDPTSPWVVVNKRRPLPAGYAPSDLVAPAVPLRLSANSEEMMLRKEASGALQELFKGASAEGISLLLASGYRSEAMQKNLYAGYVRQKGQAAADTDSARAGHSEHQTGWGVDLGRADRTCEVEACFADTAEGKWLVANAHTYGFVIRYLPNKQLVTGYVYEPWHLRYVGKSLATAVKNSGLTLEEFFGLPAAPDYGN